jgi:hypothetical protein
MYTLALVTRAFGWYKRVAAGVATASPREFAFDGDGLENIAPFEPLFEPENIGVTLGEGPWVVPGLVPPVGVEVVPEITGESNLNIERLRLSIDVEYLPSE